MGLFDFLKKRNNQNKQVYKSNDKKGFGIGSLMSVKTEIINTSHEPDVIPYIHSHGKEDLDIWSLSEKVKNGFNLDLMEIYADGYFPYTNSIVKMA
jgi:hypothetical protein